MNNFLILLVVGALLGMFGGNAISKLNPFKVSRTQVVKQESSKEEYFRDKVKGFEYRMREKNKGQTPTNARTSIGSSIGQFIDNSFKLVIGFFVVGLVVLFLTGINIFKWTKNILVQLNSTRKALKQTVKGIEKAKPKLNGNDNILKNELAKGMDEESKLLIDEIKRT